MNLEAWAGRWCIPDAAMDELKAEMLSENTLPLIKGGESEAAVQAEVRLEGAEINCPLWRNNVGVLKDERGVPVRFGLANDSKAVNQRIKSSDLIGCKPVLISIDMVGQTIGQFVARETKRRNWVYRGNDREQAQLKFMNIVNALGGDAAFANGRGTLRP